MEFQVPTHPNDLTDSSDERYSVDAGIADEVQEMDAAAQKSAIGGGILMMPFCFPLILAGDPIILTCNV